MLFTDFQRLERFYDAEDRHLSSALSCHLRHTISLDYDEDLSHVLAGFSFQGLQA